MKKERRTKITVEVYSDLADLYFIDIIEKKQTKVIGPFNSLDETLRYVYSVLDDPEGTVTVTSVSTGEVTFHAEFSLTPSSFSTKSKKEIKDNVIPFRRKE
jgi:hypothetical protein